jgi:CubicO group peptidase (beta-lactamase class C family)
MRVEACAGDTVLGRPQPITRDTIFWIASMTKPVTAVAAMQLIEAGKLSLETPAGELLAELEHPQVLENGVLRPAATKITIKHLFTHTAGYGYPFMNKALADFIAIQPKASLPAPGTRAALAPPLLFEPGTAWEYGFSTDWLGLAVEAAAGETLDKYFETHIFGPLGMVDTRFTPTAQQRGRQAWLHERKADGTLMPKGPAAPFAEHFCSGGGGLFSTLADYAKFLGLFLEEGAGILSPASITAMRTNQIGPLTAGVNFGSGITGKWGLGFMVYPQQGPNGRSAGSYGWSGMANTYFWIDPEINQAAMILMQNLPPGDPVCLKTYNQFEKAIYAAAQ